MSFGPLFREICSFLQVFDALCARILRSFPRFFASAVTKEMTSCCSICLAVVVTYMKGCTRLSHCKSSIFLKWTARSFSPKNHYFGLSLRHLTRTNPKVHWEIDLLLKWVQNRTFCSFKFVLFGTLKFNCQFLQTLLHANWERISFQQLKTHLTPQELIESERFTCC